MVKERMTNPSKSSLEILADINKLQKQGQCTDANWQSYLWFWKHPSTQFANDYSWLVSSSDLRSSLSSPMSIIPHTSSSSLLYSSSLSKSIKLALSLVSTRHVTKILTAHIVKDTMVFLETWRSAKLLLVLMRKP